MVASSKRESPGGFNALEAKAARDHRGFHASFLRADGMGWPRFRGRCRVYDFLLFTLDLDPFFTAMQSAAYAAEGLR